MTSDLEDREDLESEEEGEEEDDDGKMRFNEAKDAIKTTWPKGGKTATDEDVDDFLLSFGDVARQCHDQYGTLLHAVIDLVDSNLVLSKDVRPLVKRLAKEYGDLLRTPNNLGQTPLYKAIACKKHLLVDYMLASCSNSRALDDALEMKCVKEFGKTCLHLAFEKDINAGVTGKLIDRASDEALAVMDDAGKTSFHYSVSYGHCSKRRVDNIKLLIKRDAEAIAKQRKIEPSQPVHTFLDFDDNSGMSVYREHLASATQYKRAKRAAEQKKVAEQKKADEAAAAAAAAEAANEAGQVAGEGDNGSIAMAIRSEPKAVSRLREPKHQVGQGRDRGSGRTDRDRDKGKGLDSVDANQQLRQQLREKEAREREELERGKKLNQYQGPEGKVPHRGQVPVLDVRNVAQSIAQEESHVQIIASSPRGAEPSANTPIKRAATWRLETLGEKKGPPKKPSKPKAPAPDEQVLAENSEKVLRKLKLHYMRTRNIEMSTSFLYGKNAEDVQIYFDYHGLPAEVTDHVFKKNFGTDKNSGLRFDQVLHFVRFTNVAVKRTGRGAGDAGGVTLGRRDMEFFFDWLYDKGVRRILRLVVEDSATAVHGDEAIQKSLRRIMIESLDWQKTDLDPQTICRIGIEAEKKCPTKEEPDRIVFGPRNKLKELTLKWSGNNAVLRAWSEPEGLPLLMRLKTVHLVIPPATSTYDSSAWLSQNVVEFQARLNKNIQAMNASKVSVPESKPGEVDATITAPEEKLPTKTAESPPPPRPPVVVFEVIGQTDEKHKVVSKDTAEAKATTDRTITSHEWLKCMYKFADKIRPFWTETHSRFLNRLGEGQGEAAKETVSGVEKDVVVALIDDGVASCEPFFAGRIIEGKTFDYQDGRVGQWYVSAGGHGTEMARMILKVCPMAKIYPIRLKTHIPAGGEKHQIVLKSAAMAIDAALEKNATIISMSWTVPVPDESSEDSKLLKEVLQRACDRKVLMFCSSPDSGQFTDQDYPTAYKRDSFFRIGAAHDDGSAYSYAGHISNLDFIFPGVNVDTSADGSDRRVHLVNDGSAPEGVTGSSIATALAAGLAATIIYCFKASALAVLTSNAQNGSNYKAGPGIVIKPEQVKKMAEHSVMKSAFRKLGEVTEGHFIQVWEAFGLANKVFDDPKKNYDDEVVCIMNLCSNLIKHEMR